jgi:hypothetical protein
VSEDDYMATSVSAQRTELLRRGYVLEGITLGWNVIGVVVLAIAAISARSVALGGFGLDSLIEIGASTVVIWELSGTGERRQALALRIIGVAFLVLALYLAIQSTFVLAVGYQARHSVLGISWTAATAVVMFALAAGKERTGRALDNPVLRKEGRVTYVDALLATAVLGGACPERVGRLVVGRSGGGVCDPRLRGEGGLGGAARLSAVVRAPAGVIAPVIECAQSLHFARSIHVPSSATWSSVFTTMIRDPAASAAVTICSEGSVPKGRPLSSGSAWVWSISPSASSQAAFSTSAASTFGWKTSRRVVTKTSPPTSEIQRGRRAQLQRSR